MMKNKGSFLIALICLMGISACRPVPSFPPRTVVESTLPVQLKWQAQVDEQVDTQPVISKDLVVVATDRALYGFDKESGARLWRHEFNKYQPYPVVLDANDDIGVFIDGDGLVTALKLNSGEMLWSSRPCGRMDNYYDLSSILVVDGIVYSAFQPTVIEARQIESGDLIWAECNPAITIPSRGARLFLSGKDLYVTTTEVHVLNADNGEIERASKMNIAGVAQQENGRFYGTSWVRDAETLRLINELKSPTYKPKPYYGNCDPYRPPYTFYDDQFFGIGTCGGLMALDQGTNDIQWSYNIDIVGKSPTAIYHNILYVLFKNGEIHAVEPIFGDSMGVLKMDIAIGNLAEPSGGIVADDDTLIVTFGDNNVWAFE